MGYKHGRSPVAPTLVALVLVLGAALSISVPVWADISIDFKQTLSYKVEIIKDKLDELRISVREDLADALMEAKYWLIRALWELKFASEPLTPLQSASIGLKIDNATDSMKLALDAVQTGAVKQAKDALEGKVEEMMHEIQSAEDTDITQTEAEDLIENYLKPMLCDLGYKNELLEDIDLLLEKAENDLKKAKAYVAEGDREEAEDTVDQAEWKLERALRRVWRVKENLTWLRGMLYCFLAKIYMAPLKASSISAGLLGPSPPPSPSEPFAVEELRISPPRGGIIRFAALGRGIEAIRVQVFDLTGRRVFDSSFVRGDALEWPMTDSQGKALANGVYLYVMMVKGFDSQVLRSEVQKLAILR